jgi:hypothetical protein
LLLLENITSRCIKYDYPGSVFRKPASGPGASRQKIESRSTSVIMMVASEQFIILEHMHA